jgi:hypothetical protein
VPFGEVATVPPDRPGGRPYRETILAGATEGLDPTTVTLESGAHGGPLVGRGLTAEADGRRLRMALLVSRTRDGDELLELARDGVYRHASVVFRPVEGASRTRSDGVVERARIEVRRVAVLERGAYQGAQVEAVRAEAEEDMPEQAPVTAPAETEDETQPEAPPAAAATPTGDRPNRTRVTVDVERAAAERQDAALLSRGAAQTGQLELSRGTPWTPPIRITRDELVYGPSSGRRWLVDLVRSAQGDSEAAEAYTRHGRMLDDVCGQIVGRGTSWALELARAGDFLSSEAAGAYPNVYLPGLLTPRILKGRPMGGFYENYPINNALPQIFPKVTTSTVVAVQSAEGAAPSSTDIATTAVTTTPSTYSAYVDVSRQLIDGGSPAADQMLYADLAEAYGQVSEAAIKTAVEAGSTASGVAITAATPYAGTLANVINHYAVRLKSATGAFIPSALFPVLAAQGDTTGRPFLPMIGAVNSDGTTLADDLSLDLAVLTARGKLSYASTVNVCVFGRPQDFVVFESPIMRFSYEQPVGPQAIRIGVWAYLGIGARLGSLKVTAA